MNIKQFQARQGDVLIESVNTLPADAQKADGRVILAHGEVTGHAHEIDEEAAEAWRSGESLMVKVTRSAPVTHQEHAAIPLERGLYRVTRQREYSPESIRNVAD